MEMDNPTFQEALVELFLNTFSSPPRSKGALRPEIVGTKSLVQRIELKGKDGRNSMVDVSSLSFPSHSSTPPQVYVPIRAF